MLHYVVGRAAMIGFFMAYFVDSLTGVGLVDQLGNFFCKRLLFVAVAGVLFIRKNEDVDKLKKLFDETTLYDKQWQAAWKDGEEDTSSSLGSKKCKAKTETLASFFWLYDVVISHKEIRLFFLGAKPIHSKNNLSYNEQN